MSTLSPPSRRSRTGIVQAVGRRPADIERRPWESAAVFVVFAAVYSVVGHWLVVDMHVVGFETLDRTLRAFSVVHDDPAELASVGFDYPPLAVLLLVPSVLVPSVVTSLAVVPVVSAVFAALTMVVLNTMMRRAQVALALRVLVLAALGLNPLVVMYASIGARNFLWLALVVAALGALFAWYVTADIRFVMVAGLAFSVASLAGYSSLVWFLVAVVMVGAVLARLGADGTEIEGTTVGLASPTVYVVALWTLLNLVLLGDPFRWVTGSSDLPASGGLADFSFAEVARRTGDLVLHGAPIALVVLPALLVAGLARRNAFALWLGVLLAVSILVPGAAVLLRLTDSPLVMSNALPILLVSVIGAIWLARSAVQGSALVAVALAAGLLLSVPWTFSAMETFRQQGVERAFHDAVATGESQEGVRTLDGSYVGYDDEREMAEALLARVDRPGSVLTDDASTYAVVLLTGRPDLFLDRNDSTEEAWGEAAGDPVAADVDFLLLSVDTSRDLLSQRYPDAATGRDRVLPELFANDRYVLLAVPDGYRYGDGAATDQTDDTGPIDADPDPLPDEGGVGGTYGEGPAPIDGSADTAEPSGGTP